MIIKFIVIYLINQCEQLTEIIFPHACCSHNIHRQPAFHYPHPETQDAGKPTFMDFSVRAYYNFLGEVKDIYYTASSHAFQCVLRYGLSHMLGITAKSIIRSFTSLNTVITKFNNP